MALLPSRSALWMDVIGRRKLYLYLQHQQATCESEVIMLRSANNRAFSVSELLWALAAARATVFHGVDVVVVQKIATAVCSDVRVLLFAAPTDLTSFTSLA